MASACVNNIGLSPESFLDCSPATYSSYGWLSPRISFSRDLPEEETKAVAEAKPLSSPSEKYSVPPEISDPEFSVNDVADFEFRLDDPVSMPPADELFFDGKLVPLQVTTIRPQVISQPKVTSTSTSTQPATSCGAMEVSNTDQYLFSPKAPRCSSRWKHLLGLRKLYQNNYTKQNSSKDTFCLSSHNSTNSKYLKHFLHRSSKSSSTALDSSLSLPLLKDTDCESVSMSSRLSLSSSSSGPEHEDLPRLSLDAEKLSQICLHRNPNPKNKVKAAKPRDNPRPLGEQYPIGVRVGRSQIRRAPAESGGSRSRGVSVDSPRMNSSGKIVFQSLERSSSSPSSFNGGPRAMHRGMERSYSANVRVTPVLNVPVCSLRGSSKSGGVFGFGQLFSSQPKKESSNGRRGQHHRNGRNRTNRP